MGCIGIRSKTPEEASLIEAEKSLMIHTVESQLLDSTFRKYSYLGKVNQSQLTRISAALNIHIENYESHTNINKMFDALKRFSDEYTLRDLLVIGILLSKSEDKIKATLLFQVFDETLEGAIEITRIQGQVFKVIISNCVNILGNLILDTWDETKLAQRYLKQIKSAEIVAIRQLVNYIAKDKSKQVVSEEEFVDGMCRFRWGDLLTPSGWRVFLKETRDKYPNEINPTIE